jgi:general secretion pathway protein E
MNTNNQSATALSLDQLDGALARARARAAVPLPQGGLWQRLLRELQVSEVALASALMDMHGVAVLEDSQWRRGAQQGSLAEAGCLLQCDDIKYLVSEDPWSGQALRVASRGAYGAVQLALARPGQVAVEAAAPAPHARSVAGANGTPVVRFVDDAIAGAYHEGASDIHFETDRGGISVKYRLDGVMSPAARLNDPQRAEETISRIKVLAQLDITERRRPQDGRFRWSGAHNESVDLRVSVMPSIFGEDAVLRLLDKAQLRSAGRHMTLEALGFGGATAAKLRSLAARPHGMLLMTGPTGSGKTTTVYAALTEVNDGLEKIITIEDPVEYELPGVLQIPVNEQKGLTFATGLRSILRHDPDKILVGEIRDSETAEIAVQSALTGHLVFTTVHANSLTDVLGRFQHFGIDPFALASALNGVVVQRLLRRLCEHCRTWRALTEAEAVTLRRLGLQLPAHLPVPCGCQQCRQTGYKGRLVIAEVHEINDVLKDLIVRRATMSELKGVVYADGEERLLESALNMVGQGITSLEEVGRVIGLV